MVSIIIENLADQISREEILEEYEGLSEEDIDAALNYAALLTRESVVSWN